VYSVVALHSPYGVCSISPVVCTLTPVHLIPEWHALVYEVHSGPVQHKVVELLKALVLEGVADDHDVCRVYAISPWKCVSEKSMF